jgi:SSS family solute:Na+ symporter
VATVIFAAIIVFSLVLALLAARGRDVLKIEEYLVGGRSFSGVLLFFLAVGEIYSIGTMVGLPGGIYANGASYGIWFLGYILLAYPVGYFLAPLVWRAGKRYGSMTFPDMLKTHYSSRLLEVVAALTFFAYLIPWAQLQFAGLQVALGALGFGISPTTATAVAAVIAFAYIIFSGVRAPANISILKDILLFGAIVIVGVAAAYAVGGVADVFGAAAKVNPSSLIVGEGQAMTFALTTIVFQALGFITLTTPFIFTGRSEATVKRTYIVMPLYMLMYPFLIFAAYYAISAVPDLEQPNAALFAASVELLPPWLLGLMAGAAALSGLLILAVLSLTIGGVLSRNITPNLPDNSQRRLTQVVVTVYLIATAALTILAPALMLNLISAAYFFVTQLLPGLIGILFVRQFSALGLTAGLIAGNAAVLVLNFSQPNLAGINIGLVALLLNFAVTIAVSAVTKNESSLAPVAASRESAETRRAERSVT